MARELREDILRHLGASAAPDAVLDALAGVVETDSESDLADLALTAILGSRSVARSALLVRFVDAGAGGARIVVRSLRELDRLKIRPDPGAVRKHASSHRLSVLQAARPIAEAMGLGIPESTVGPSALAAGEGAALLARLLEIVGPGPSGMAAWVEIQTRPKPAAPAAEWRTANRGWLVADRQPLAVAIETPHGYLKDIDLPALARGTDGESEVRVVQTPISTEVERVLGIRARMNVPLASDAPPAGQIEPFDLRGELSDRGFLTAQFEPWSWSLHEFLLGLRLHQSGQVDLAARILLPVIDATPSDAAAVRFVAWSLGDALGHRMIAAFCRHDLAGTAELAERLATRHAGTRFAGLAARIRDELPRRQGDWSAFSLPRPEEWQMASGSIGREQQIRHLCGLLRLLTSVDSGIIQIGPFLGQHASTPVVDHRAASILRWDGDEVINPCQVLRDGPLAPREDGTGARGIDAGDFGILRSCQAQDWLAPCVSAWRGFHPTRTVATTSGLIDELIAECGPK